MSRVFILPYKMGSEGAKALSEALGCKRLYNDSRSKYWPRYGDVIINWGLSVIPSWREPHRRSAQIYLPTVLNKPEAVRRACNKLVAYEYMLGQGVPVPEFTSYPSCVQRWLQEGSQVFARKILSGSCGAGIEILSGDMPIPRAPLYTKHFNAKREYRVHVVRGNVIDYVKKGKRRDREVEPNLLVRNHENGWVFMRDGVELPEEVAEAAIKAVASLGLDFGAVDVGWRNGVCAVYEVNCAPGYEAGTITAQKYARAFREVLNAGGGE